MMFRINNCTAFRLCCEGKMFFGGTYGVVLLELDVYLALGSCGLLGGLLLSRWGYCASF